MDKFENLLIVIPYAPWCYQQSYNILGKPAQHLIVAGDLKTICGREANGWAQHGYVDPAYIENTGNGLCKICQKVYRKNILVTVK